MAESPGQTWVGCLTFVACSRTDNEPRVRDGYASLGTCGHARALATQAEEICRTNLPARDRTCTPLPPQNFHGKEGVGGSSRPGGLTTCKTATFHDYRAPLDQGGGSRIESLETRRLPAKSRSRPLEQGTSVTLRASTSSPQSKQ